MQAQAGGSLLRSMIRTSSDLGEAPTLPPGISRVIIDGGEERTSERRETCSLSEKSTAVISSMPLSAELLGVEEAAAVGGSDSDIEVEEAEAMRGISGLV